MNWKRHASHLIQKHHILHTDSRNIVGLCNWDQPQLTSQMCEELYQNMEKAKIRSEHIFLFSATRFEPMLAEHAKTDDRFELIDMNEL